MSDDGRLAGKVAVVTGGGNGLGRATAVRFAEEGAAVVVADLLDGPGHETVAQIEAGGGRAVFVSVDVTSRADNDAMARTAIEQFDGLHVVVTAAGVATGGYVSGDLELAQKSMRERYEPDPARGFVNLDIDDWQSVLDINLTGTLKSLQSCVGAMLDHGCARDASLITIASIAAKHPDAGSLPYGVSKAGVWWLTKKLARELVGAGIRVERHRPRVHRDQHDRAHAIHARGSPAAHRAADPDGPHGHAAGDRRHRAVPGVRRGELLHRRDPPPGRRLLHRVAETAEPRVPAHPEAVRRPPGSTQPADGH